MAPRPPGYRWVAPLPTVAETLAGAIAERVVTAAQVAFVDALHLVAAVAALSAIVAAIAATIALWKVPRPSEQTEA